MTVASATDNSALQSLQSRIPIQREPESLGQAEFLKLMITQLENQDPTKPMDSFEFLSQIAQFSTVSGIQGIENSFSNFSDKFFSSMALDAAGMVGKTAITPSNAIQHQAGQQASASINVSESVPEINVAIQDSAGNVVRQITLGSTPQGVHDFSWDGLDESGQEVEEGTYHLSASAGLGEASFSVPVFAHQEIKSVLFDQQSSDVILSLSDGSDISLSDVLGFH